jgi:hypothetical protein
VLFTIEFLLSLALQASALAAAPIPAPIAASTHRERRPELTSSRAIFSRKTDTGSDRPGTSMVRD